MADDKTFTIMARGDIRALATLLKMYKAKGLQPPKSNATLIRNIVKDFADVMIKSDCVEKVTTFSEAADVFETAGLSLPHHRDRGKKHFIDGLAAEIKRPQHDVPSIDTTTMGGIKRDLEKHTTT